MKVVVIGSSNIDMVAQVNHLPAPGETVGDASFIQSLGGKGANQAVAAARLGGSVTFITSLGNDMYAEILKKHFKKEGIATDYIIDDVNQPTGTALIFVADSGENCIAVAPGANYSLLPGSITHFSKVIDEADIIVMQAEIPYETIKKIALSAKKKGKKLGRPTTGVPKDFIKEYNKFQSGEYGNMSVVQFAKLQGIAVSTFYKYVNLLKEKGS